MTLQEIKALVLSADPNAQHYSSTHDAVNYTTWREYRRLSMTSDDTHVKGWAFQIDRFTYDEFDVIAEAIEAALENAPGVAYGYQVDYEPDTEYIHHIFECEGI